MPATEVVTQTVTKYVPVDDALMPQVEDAYPVSGIWSVGNLSDAWTHDRAQLQICKPNLDAIRKLMDAQKKTPGI